MLSSSWATVIAAVVAAVPQASVTPCLFSWRGATLSLPRGPRPSRSVDWAHLSSPCTEVWLQLPLDPQLHQFPSPLLPHGDALGKLTEPAPLPLSPSPAEMPRFSSRRPGPKAPGLTHHMPFFFSVGPAAPQEGIFRALSVEWKSRSSTLTSPQLIWGVFSTCHPLPHTGALTKRLELEGRNKNVSPVIPFLAPSLLSSTSPNWKDLPFPAEWELHLCHNLSSQHHGSK